MNALRRPRAGFSHAARRFFTFSLSAVLSTAAGVAAQESPLGLAPARAAEDTLSCQRAIELFGVRFARQLLRGIDLCARQGTTTPLETCLASSAVREPLARLRALWGAKLGAACATTDVWRELGYLETCAAPPSTCTFASVPVDTAGEANDLVDCLACRITEHLRAAADKLFAGKAIKGECHNALGAGGLRTLRWVMHRLQRCLRRAGTISIAACLDSPRRRAAIERATAIWRAAAEDACATADPFATPGYPQLCASIQPAFPSICASTDRPCIFPPTTRLNAPGADNDLLDCLACQVEEAALAVARELYGANLCCTAAGCRTVRTRVACREAEGTPAHYRIDSVEAGSLAGPHGIAVGNDGTLYIADSGHGQITSVGPQGEVRVIASLQGWPTGVAVDSSGMVYVSLRCEHKVVRVTPSGTASVFAGTGTPGHSEDGTLASAAQLIAPNRVAVDDAGNVYITESAVLAVACRVGAIGKEDVRLVDPTGIIHTVAGVGTFGGRGEGAPALDAEVGLPYSLWNAADGSLLIGDDGLNRVLRVDRAGILTRVAGRPLLFVGSYSGDGGPATRARFYHACGVASDTGGKIFVGHMMGNRVRLVDSRGSVITVAGTGERSYYGDPSGDGGPAELAEAGCPEDVAVGPDGRVYFADLWASRIRVLTLEPF